MGVLPLYQRQAPFFSRRYPRIALILAGFLIRIYSIDFQGLWRDEVDQWRFALSPLRDQFSHFFEIGWNGPLFSPILRLWIAGVGDSVFGMRYFSLLCGVLCIPLIYVLSQRMLDKKTAVWSVLLYAFSPYMVWYAQEVKMYTWVPMLVLLGLYSLERACRVPGWKWWVITFTATCAAFYSHILAALVIPVQFVWYWRNPKRHKKAWIGGAVILLLLVVPYVPLLFWQLPMVFTARETGYPTKSLFEMVSALLTGWTAGIYMGAWTNGFIWHAVTGLSGACALFGLTVLVRERYRQLSMLLAWLVLPLLAIWIFSLKSPIFADRYLIWTAPAFFILAAHGISQFAKININLMWFIGLTVVLSAFPALYSQSTLAIKPQYQILVNYLMRQDSAEDLFLFQIPYNARVFEYYARNQIYHQDGAPYTNWHVADGSYQVGESYVHQEMKRLTGEYSKIWLIYSEVELWDERELVKDWLDSRWILADERIFRGVTLYAYERP